MPIKVDDKNCRLLLSGDKTKVRAILKLGENETQVIVHRAEIELEAGVWLDKAVVAAILQARFDALESQSETELASVI